MTVFTPGPWRWFGDGKYGNLRLATPRHGQLTVMDFVRMGLNDAQPRFRLTANLFDAGGLYLLTEPHIALGLIDHARRELERVVRETEEKGGERG